MTRLFHPTLHRTIVAVHLPFLATDLLRGRAEAPPVSTPLVTATGTSRRAVVHADYAALDAGVHPGLTVAKARVLVRDVVVVEDDPTGQREVLKDLALECLRYAPLVAMVREDGIVIDVTGADHLHGGLRPLTDDLHRRLAQAGYTSRIAIASNASSSWALARFANADTGVRVYSVDEEVACVLTLPLAALDLDDRTRRSLLGLGLVTVGDLARIPRGPLAKRHGRSVVLALDRLQGAVASPMAWLRFRDRVAVERRFLEPVLDHDQLGRLVAEACSTLCRELEARTEGARHVDLVVYQVDGDAQAIGVGFSAPSRAAEHIAGLLARRFDRLSARHGAEGLRLVASVTSPLEATAAPFGLADEGIPAAVDRAALVDRICSRPGIVRVYGVRLHESRVPERSFRWVDPLLEDDDSNGAYMPPPRPTRLLPRPEPITAVTQVPDHPPAFFVWRRVRHRVVHSDGPERIRGEWWRKDREREALRDYYVVEDETGQRFWIFRNAAMEDVPAWFLHGVW